MNIINIVYYCCYRLLQLLTPNNVNCHASDGRRSTPLHLAAGYNRSRVVQLLLQHGADIHAKDKGFVFYNFNRKYNSNTDYLLFIFFNKQNRDNFTI